MIFPPLLLQSEAEVYEIAAERKSRLDGDTWRRAAVKLMDVQCAASAAVSSTTRRATSNDRQLSSFTHLPATSRQHHNTSHRVLAWRLPTHEARKHTFTFSRCNYPHFNRYYGFICRRQTI